LLDFHFLVVSSQEPVESDPSSLALEEREQLLVEGSRFEVAMGPHLPNLALTSMRFETFLRGSKPSASSIVSSERRQTKTNSHFEKRQSSFSSGS
jgi:hypothetical protein